MTTTLGQQAKTNGLEYCSKCKAWKLYEQDGKCRDCGKQILVISESVVLADLRTRYGVE